MSTQVLKIAGIALAGVCLLAVVKKRASELALPVQLGVAAAVVLLFLPTLSEVLPSLGRLASAVSSDYSYTGVLFKGTAIALLGSAASDVCRDNGETAIAGAVDTGVRVLVLALALPAAEILLGLALSMLGV